jgi:hypothetical protein
MSTIEQRSILLRKKMGVPLILHEGDVYAVANDGCTDMATSQQLPVMMQLPNIDITAQLQLRRPRQADIRRENLAFRELATLLAAQPKDGFLQSLTDLTIKLCDADTVGISVEQTDEKGNKIFRWVAIAGELKNLIGGTTPRNFSPCGVCVDKNQPLLMEHLDLFYPYFKEAPLPFVEALLLPWEANGVAAGTLWAVAHSDRRKFDGEDARLLACLAAFVSGAMQLRLAILAAERAAAAAEIRGNMAHHINNPLQAAILAIYYLRSKCELSPDASVLISQVDDELRRVVRLSEEILHQPVGTR